MITKTFRNVKNLDQDIKKYPY
jgi:hypothetical protein